MRKRKIFGTQARPRLSVWRSLKNIHAQIIDDVAGKTLVAQTSLKMKNGGNIAGAKAVGVNIAAKAKAAGISLVVFDRGKFRYHGRIKALADAAREGGLVF
ncbi:50S ribosomal protein L18 [Candidatus Saganbacteria bacterium CG08_land_8_20_14_0_20_45_16]|uniref:Large ribosomal subunit protein uL18 n=1 Tax=Candidatus Saganbacteria bacterium CG08_land_8_20_14_0_20_45_16 TaxID=2014293 RepID=A0A2H0XZL7_UNCSA|nr:MAG: 50S ribosomal protein L18 [Candidatus Saganbacteria bacterium CG08_land_8_20_14_0_20_45_16]